MTWTIGRIEMGRGSGGVVFSVDVSASAVIGDVKSSLSAYLAQSQLPDVALVSHSDYPGFVINTLTGVTRVYGSAIDGDYAFRIDSPFARPVDVIPFVTNLVMLFGGDPPESYTRIAWEMTQQDTLQLLGGSVSDLVMFVDNVPHGWAVSGGVVVPEPGFFDPGRIGDVGGLIPQTNPIFLDASIATLREAGGRLVIVDGWAVPPSPLTAFWAPRADAYLAWNGITSTLISFLNANL